jgi:serine/threonine-protein kinase
MEGRIIAQPDPLIGTTLLDRYVIQERIGAGAMGAVYRAQQVGLGRPVALKVLKRQQSCSPDVIARFEREAKAMSALVHPNTVRVYDFGLTPEGLLFLAMELLEGELATTRLGRVGPATMTEALTWVRQVLRSLGEAHAKGIIHRDVKPDNIFLARMEGVAEPVAKVLDFGIAKAIEGEHKVDQFETQDGTVFGTPRYMSPEQAQGKPLDHRSDLYAVGIVLYELLVGAPPFVDRDAVVVMAKHIRDEPAPLRISAPIANFPPSLQRVMDKALHKSPALRFQSAEDFDRALVRCLRDAELIERMPQRGRKYMVRALGAPRWTQWSIGAGVLVALVAIAGAAPIALRGARGGDATAKAAPARTSAVAANHPPAPASSKQPAPPAAPETRMVTLYTEPKGANVWHYSRFVGVTPLPIEVQDGKAVRVRVSMPGFESQTLDLAPKEGSRMVTLERSRTEAAALTAEQRPHAPPRRPHRPAATHAPATKTEANGDAYEKF